MARVVGTDFSDPAQFSRPVVVVDSSAACPQPYSSSTGPEFCSAWCLNTCTSDAPTNASADALALKAARRRKEYVDLAVTSSEAVFNESSRNVIALGSASFAGLFNQKPQPVLQAVVSALAAVEPFVWNVCLCYSLFVSYPSAM